MSGDKLAPIGPEMVRRNRRLIAERLRWPVAAVVTCEQVERVHPGWSVSYFAETTRAGFERPAGFYASHRNLLWSDKPPYGRDVHSLRAGISAAASVFKTRKAADEVWRRHLREGVTGCG